jgi:hypothetical protein
MHGSKPDAKLEAHWLTKEEQVRAFFALQSAGWWEEDVCCLFSAARRKRFLSSASARPFALSSIAAFIDEASAQSRLLHTQLPRDGRVYCHQGMFQTQPLSINTRRPTTTIRFDSNYYYLFVRVGCILDVVT